MANTVLSIAKVFGGASVILLVITFIIGLLRTLSFKGALGYIKAALVLPFIGLLLYIICYGVIYAIFSLLDLPYL